MLSMVFLGGLEGVVFKIPRSYWLTTGHKFKGKTDRTGDKGNTLNPQYFGWTGLTSSGALKLSKNGKNCSNI